MRVPASRGSAQIRLGRLQPVHHGHPDVHEHDVGAGRANDVHGLTTVGRLADHREALFVGDEFADGGADQGLVVGEYDGDHGFLFGSVVACAVPR